MEQSGALDLHSMLEMLGVRKAQRVEPVSGGTDTSIWRVEGPDGAYALRVFQPGQARRCEREVAAMTASASGGIPVPQVLSKGVWQDRPVLLLSWCPGQRMEQELTKRPRRAWKLAMMMGRTQTAIHRIPAPPELLQAPDAWIEWAGPNEHELKQRLLALKPRSTMLLHLDYHARNVMTDGERITGVLDWANTLAGDPRACFARTHLLHSLIPAVLNWSFAARVSAWLFVQAWKRGYRRGGQPLRDMELFYAWAGVVTVRDFERKPRPNALDPFIGPMRRWTTVWKRRAGLPA